MRLTALPQALRSRLGRARRALVTTAYFGFDVLRLGRWSVRPWPVPHWMLAPTQKAATRALFLAAGRRELFYRALDLASGTVIKFREFCYGDKMNFVWRLDGPIDQRALRNAVVFQQEVFARNPELGQGGYFHVILRMNGAAADPRLMDLMSLGVLSQRILNLNLFFSDADAEADLKLTMSNTERLRWAGDRNGYDLAEPRPVALEQVERDGLPEAFRATGEARRAFNTFLKAVAPAGLVIAVSLREDDNGTARGDDLSLLVEAAARLQASQSVTFLVMNAVSVGELDARRPGVVAVRDAGFKLMDVLALTGFVDGFFGVLDCVGIAARSARRPGLYLSLEATDELDAVFSSPETVVTALRRVIAQIPAAAVRVGQGSSRPRLNVFRKLADSDITRIAAEHDHDN